LFSFCRVNRELATVAWHALDQVNFGNLAPSLPQKKKKMVQATSFSPSIIQVVIIVDASKTNNGVEKELLKKLNDREGLQSCLVLNKVSFQCSIITFFFLLFFSFKKEKVHKTIKRKFSFFLLKIDQVNPRDKLLEITETYHSIFPQPVFMISALKKQGVDDLRVRNFFFCCKLLLFVIFFSFLFFSSLFRNFFSPKLFLGLGLFMRVVKLINQSFLLLLNVFGRKFSIHCTRKFLTLSSKKTFIGVKREMSYGLFRICMLIGLAKRYLIFSFLYLSFFLSSFMRLFIAIRGHCLAPKESRLSGSEKWLRLRSKKCWRKLLD